MAEVRTKDVLLRVGGRTLQRTGTLCAAGAGRGYVELPYTFTRASTLVFRDRDGIGRKAAANNVAIEYPGELSGLVDSAGLPYCGPRLNGARTQLVTDPENFGAWTMTGTAVLTSGQADPFGGTAAYQLNDDDAAVSEFINTAAIAFTADGTKVFSVFVRQGTSTVNEVRARDVTAGFIARHSISITWAGGVPTLGTVAGSGTLYPVENWGGGWWRVSFSANGIVAANTNDLILSPALLAPASNTGTAFFFGANAWNAPFPSSYQGPSGGASPSAADSLIVPVNFGGMDTTILWRIARTAVADAATGISGIYDLGNAGVQHAWTYFDRAAPSYFISIADATPTGRSVAPAIPAGAVLSGVQQLDQWPTPRTRADVGSGFTAYSGNVPLAIPKWQNQTLQVGGIVNGGNSLWGVLLDLIVFRGLFSLNECLAVP